MPSHGAGHGLADDVRRLVQRRELLNTSVHMSGSLPRAGAHASFGMKIVCVYFDSVHYLA